MNEGDTGCMLDEGSGLFNSAALLPPIQVDTMAKVSLVGGWVSAKGSIADRIQMSSTCL
jgi:hypothetical protein